jgi:predicted mannosyl-3-phosphoglycerate phosphatase (HAD superfamily)
MTIATMRAEMRYLALATDYDGTLTTSDRLSSAVERALEQLRASGRRVVLLTGRTLEELAAVCDRFDLFDSIVLENGAVLYSPPARKAIALRTALPRALEEELLRRRVTPLVRGSAILATRRPHEITVLETIRDLGLEAQIIFNGGAVMVVPSGTDKGSGLTAALKDLGMSSHEVVGIGSAENDHSFLDICECAVAVGNAIDSIKVKVDFCTAGLGGFGVTELVSELVTTDLSRRFPGGVGDVVVLAERDDGSEVTFPPYGHNIFVSGPSGAGKSTFATGLIERLMERNYQLCIVDPEGDYSTLAEAVTIGSRVRPPHMEEIIDRLRDSSTTVVVNLLGIPLQDRPDFFSQLFPSLQALRARTGRPHWIVLDEVHHLVPALWGLAPSTFPRRLGETLLITHRPQDVSPTILSMVDTAVAVGPGPETTLASFASSLDIPVPSIPDGKTGEVMVWQRSAGAMPFAATVVPSRSERIRHLRKYSEGNLGPKSFFFRGSGGKMNLRAQNLAMFCDLTLGIDDDTWLYHLHRGDYSQWIGGTIKDDALMQEVVQIEQASHLASSDSRRLVCEAIERRYLLSG